MMMMRVTESGGSRLDGLPGPTTSENYQQPNLGSESVDCRSPPTDISPVREAHQRPVQSRPNTTITMER